MSAPEKANGMEKEILRLREKVGQLESELDRTRTQLDLAHHQLKLGSAILDNIPSFATVKDADGRYQLINREAQRIIGKSSAEIAGKLPQEIYPEELAESIHKDDMAVIESGEPITVEERLRLDDERQFLTTKVPLLDSRGQVEGLVGLATDITELKKAQKALSESEELLNAIFRNAVVAIVMVDPDGAIIKGNEQAVKMLGYADEIELLGLNIVDDVTHPDFRQKSSGLRQSLTDGKIETYNLEKKYLRKDGSELWCDIYVYPIMTSEKGQKFSVGFLVDVTERRKAQEALRESEAMLSTLFNSAGVAIVVVRQDTTIIKANKFAWEIMGYDSEEELLGKKILDITHPDFHDEHKKQWGDSDSGLPVFYKTEKKYVRKDGSEIWGEVYVYPINSLYQGEQVAVGMTVDVTERKKAVLALEHRVEFERMLAKISSDFIKIDIDAIDDGIRNALAEMGEFAGEDRGFVSLFSPDRKTMDITHEWCREGVVSNRGKLKHMQVSEMHYAMQDILAQRIHINNSVENMPAEYKQEKVFLQSHGIKSAVLIPLVSGGDVIGFTGFNSVHSEKNRSDDDINLLKFMGDTITNALERKRIEQALRVSEERFREMTEMLPVPLLETDTKGMVTYYNRNALKKFGYTAKELRRDFDIFGLILPDEREKAREYLQQLLRGEAAGLRQFSCRRKNGSTFPALLDNAPIVEGGVTVGFRGLVIDISERQQLEEERRRSANLESVGLLAGGIAHDFNNILASITGYINMAQIAGGKGENFEEYLGSAENAAMRAKSLTQQLLTFSKGGEPVKTVVSVASLIMNSADLSLMGSNVKSVFDIDDSLWPAEVDEGQIGQVLNNIIINAKQAMPDGGMLRVSAINLPLDGKKHRVPLKNGDYLKITIADNGPGIPAKYLDKIFDPYFTTKEGGSGLGLATSYSIIVKHDGYVEVESDPKQGTAFTIYLPASPDKSVGEQQSVTEGAYTVGKVMLMDDEVELLEAVANILEFYGSTVEMARDGSEALAKYKAAMEKGKPFDVVVMDLTIPGGMGGRETIEKLLEIDPDARAIVSSGYSEDSVLAQYKLYGFAGAISKPYNHKQLMEAVSKVIRG